ncbi:LacI family transcriptional regulator [Variovorax sp. KBW07]|uniref:tripartite tricarboxylate transporter substrate binding protein n=1 Tax=Variovorax sp. KBW07 TaxID=2153358 RepID=UPI000F5884EC|nr:tripartite tricarboxylate transporter substrate binding protein [Variovorax sp. KBW07]RQO53376.1 LacI family transcriptional regulator [Variovorax sp. KBW07]
MKRRLFAKGAVAATLAATTGVFAQTTSRGVTKLVVGFPPGGGTDVLARLLAQKLGVMWGTPVVVENRAGAAGMIAAEQVARADPDGSTLLMAHINSHGIAPGLQPGLGYSAERDFAPIALVGATPQMLICESNQPVKTLKGLVALCRSRPGEIVFGSAGNGSAQHLALELFKARANIDVLHVPYKGSAPLVSDMLGGHVQYSFEGMTTARQYLGGGKMTAIAQTRLKRSKSFPAVPTLAESGFEGYEASIWFGLVGPAKMPPATIARMNKDVNTVLAMPDVVARLDQFGAEDGGGSAQRFGDFMHAEREKWARIIKTANISVDK